MSASTTVLSNTKLFCREASSERSRHCGRGGGGIRGGNLVSATTWIACLNLP